MGLMSWFGRGPLSPTKIAKAAKLAANPFAQPDVRMREMERLMGDGSAAALQGVLRRLGANAQGHIADEEEKQWLEDALVRAGAAAEAPLEAYIASGSKLTYALRAYRRIAGEAAAVRLCLATLAHYGPDDYRSGDAKLQLIWELSESLGEADVLAQLAPFLRDHGDDVRWTVLELIGRAAAEGSVAPAAQQALLPPLGYLVGDPGVSPRIARQAADLLERCGWPLPPGPSALPASLDETFFLDKKRLVRRRQKKIVASGA